MSIKVLSRVLPPSPPHFVGDGFRVHNFIPSSLPMQRMDPFIMLDYNSKFYFPPTETPRGVGAHPHRGFETVTIAYKGRVAHTDSHGGGGVIGEGDVQWMTAASGLLHKEFHEADWARQGGEFQMVQLWVNLPAQDKKSKPKYQAIAHKDMPQIPLDGGGMVELIAGEYQREKGPATTFTPIQLWNVRLPAGARFEASLPASFNTALLVIEGSIVVNQDAHVPTDHLVLFRNEGEEVHIEASSDALVLLLSGQPIGEPIAARGPFVMNSPEELLQAYEDFQSGAYGYLD
ncbi:MAG: pirin family protein [Bacteroidetes bacterium]|nr:pirin family protein [Bacteroidota bacterium]MBS1628873.1 pirin family protein [Bacteroidota bacterium]